MIAHLSGLDGWSAAVMAGLAGFVARATVVLAAAWVATRLMRHTSAAARHLVWTGAIMGVLALPVLSATLPSWRVPVIPAMSGSAAPFAAADHAVLPAPNPTPAARSIAETPAAAAAGEGTPAAVHVARVARVDAGIPAAPSFSWVTMLAVAWLAIGALLLLRLVVANVRVWGWRRASGVVEDERWLALARRLSRRFGIGRPVVLLENPNADVPVTWGVVYPVVLLPAGADAWDDEQRMAVLTHELAHVQRFDALTQLCAQVALTLLWFHPLAWTAVRRMRQEREHACDDFVIASGTRASRYADDLLQFARSLHRPMAPAAAALAMARRSELEGRLLSILDPAAKRGVVRGAALAMVGALVLAAAAPLAALTPVPRPALAAVDPVPPTNARSDSDGQPPVRRAHTPARSAAAPATEVASVRAALPETKGIDLGSLQGLTPRTTRPQPLWPESLFSGLETIRILADTEPRAVLDVETLVDVTKAVKRMTSDHEKGQLLQLVAKRFVPNDALRTAYIEAVATMTSDTEKSAALVALLDRDSLTLSSAALLVRATATMTSDSQKGVVLKRISPAMLADSAVQRAYVDAFTAMTTDTERGRAAAALLQQPLVPAVQMTLLRAAAAITSSNEKANVLILFAGRQGLTNDAVRRVFFATAETLTSDGDYRRVMAAVMR